VGEAQWGDQLAYDTVTQQLEWAIDNPDHGTTDVMWGDLDDDGATEIVWGAGHSSSGADHMYVADWSTQTHEWSSVHLDGPFRGPTLGDVDGDGLLELVTVTDGSDSGYGSGRVLVFDAATKVLRAISQEVASGLGWSGTHEVKLRNVDEDPALEIVVAASTTYDGIIEIYDFDGAATFTEIWQIPSPLPDGAFRSAEVVDVDDDGELEVVGGAASFVYVYDLATGAEEWHSLFIASYIREVAVAQTDTDGALEIIAVGSTGDTYVFDGQSKALEAILAGSSRCVRTTPGRLGRDLVILGDDLGTLTAHQHDGSAYQPLHVFDVGAQAIDGFTLGPLSQVWVGSGGVLELHSKWNGTLLWSSEKYGSMFGTQAVLLAPASRMIVAAGSYGLVGFTPP
jgi:hypothetical protein